VNVRRRAGLGVCVLVIVAAAAAGGTVRIAHARASSRGTARGAVGYAGPAQGVIRHGVASLASRNWAGYVTFKSNGKTDFNGVTSTWVQPAVTCEAKNAWTVFWAGLDGWGSGTVEQGGSSAQCIGGVPDYTVWWEMFPTNSIQTMFEINPGDTISATVTYAPSTKKFTINVRDVTSGKSFTRNEKCAKGEDCGRVSAEAIAEDVGKFGGSTYFPLADYGSVQFTKSAITDVSGRTGGFVKHAWQFAAITEQTKKTIYATVSGLSNHSTTFTATWKHR